MNRPHRQLSAIATGSLLALWILASCDGLSERILVAAGGMVSSYVGDEATLNCSVDSHIPPDQLEVNWKKKGQQDFSIILVQHGQIVPESTHEEYRGRVDIFATEIQRGNFSIRLKHIRPEDTGQYICEAKSSQVSANITAVLQGLGPPPLLITALVFCGIATILALGLGIPSFVHLLSNGDREKVLMNCLLGFFPNTIMFIAFILYGWNRGFGAEITTCTTVNLIRFHLVFKASPYLDILPAYPKKYIKGVGVMVQYLITAGVLFSDVFADISPGGMTTYLLLLFFGLHVCFYIGQMLFDGIDDMEYWCFTYVDVINWILLWLLVLGYSTFSLGMFIITLALTNAVDLLFHLQQLEHFKKIYAISTILIVVLFPVCIGTYFYYLSWILASKPEGHGLMCGSALLYSLTAASGFDYHQTTSDILLPHIFVYMFGAAVLPVVNAATLAAELITIMGSGAGLLIDLQVIVLPCECIFVCGWLALQMYYYWIRKRRIIEMQLSDIFEKLRCNMSQSA